MKDINTYTEYGQNVMNDIPTNSFLYHNMNGFGVGDMVCFKRPRRNRYGLVITQYENDYEVYWFESDSLIKTVCLNILLYPFKKVSK